MTDRTYIVTGGAGFIGSNLVARLFEAEPGARVVVFDKLTYAGNLDNLEQFMKDPRFELVHADICDREIVRNTFARVEPDVVFHLAAESHVDRSIERPGEFVRTNVIGTFELLDGVLAYWQKIGESKRDAFRFVQVSTDEVFGSLSSEGYFTEESRYEPNSPYAASKAGADHLARAYFQTFRLPVIITNCSNNYGPYQFPEKLIPLVTLNALEDKPLPVYGDGKNIRDWLFVGDHCDGLMRVATHGEAGETYTFGGRAERTTLEVVHAICAVLDALAPRASSSYRELVRFVADRPGHDRRYAIDPSKAERKLGWRAATNFDEGIEQTVAWYLRQRNWCDRITQGVYRRERIGLGRAQA